MRDRGGKCGEKERGRALIVPPSTIVLSEIKSLQRDMNRANRRLVRIEERAKDHTLLLLRIMEAVERTGDPETLARIKAVVASQKKEYLDALERNAPK